MIRVPIGYSLTDQNAFFYLSRWSDNWGPLQFFMELSDSLNDSRTVETKKILQGAILHRAIWTSSRPDWDVPLRVCPTGIAERRGLSTNVMIESSCLSRYDG